MKKLFLILVSMFLVVSRSEAQTVEQNCVHYPYNTQVGINLNVNMLSKMRIEPLSDYFQSYPSFGADFGVYLYQRVYKWFGIQISAEYSALTVCDGATSNFSDNTSIEMSYYAFGAFTFPILFNASYYFNEKHGLDISFGGAPLILFVGEAGWGVGMGNLGKNYWHYRLDYDTPFNFSLYGKLGYNFLLKNKNTLRVAIVGSYASKPYAQGRYYVLINETEEESGFTSLRNTFVGLQFSYGFTMKRLLCNPK